MNDATMPSAVYTIWWTGLLLTLLVFVPLAVYLLHRTWLAARSIQWYAGQALTAAAGIASHTQYVPALDTTIDVAGSMLGVAGQVAAKLDAAATVLAERAE